MSDIVDFLRTEVREHRRFYPSDPLNDRLDEAIAEITRLRERCEALEKRVERFRCGKCGHDTFVGKVPVEMKEPDHAD